jgi:hypothetical protein
LGALKGGSSDFVYGTVTRCGRPFHTGSTVRELCNSLEARQHLPSGPTTPTWQRLPALPPRGFRLCPFRSPLLGASLLFSLPRGTEMFQFPRFPSGVLCVQTPTTRHDPCQVRPFGNPRINASLAAPRGLSQPATSFVGFQRLGIHRVPLKTCRDDARARYEVHKDQQPACTARTRHLRRAVHHTDRAPDPTGPGQERNRIPQNYTVCPPPPATPPSGPDRTAVPPVRQRHRQTMTSQ